MAKPVSKPPITSLAPVVPAPWTKGESVYFVGQACIDGVDALAIELERKWGCGRLRLLVDDDLRARFDAQRLKFNRAIKAGELEDVKRESTRMQNAWRALDAAATAAGKGVLSPQVWEVVLPGGKVAAIARTNEDAHAVLADGRRIDVFTLDEIANLIFGFPEIARIKQTFPGAEVMKVWPVQDPIRDFDEDAIPWPEEIRSSPLH